MNDSVLTRYTNPLSIHVADDAGQEAPLRLLRHDHGHAETHAKARPSTRTASPWFVRFRETPAPEMRLFCFPYAGAGAGVFRGWAGGLAPRVDVVALQLPGRGARFEEAPATDFALVSAQVAEAVAREAGHLPFAILGHSMGALLMFEVTRRLAALGRRTPECVFASGRQAPHLPLPAERRHSMSDADFIAELRRLDGTPREILDNPELLALLMPCIRGDFALIDSWRFTPSQPLNVPLYVLGGRSDPHVPMASTQAWEEWAGTSFELLTYAGGHFFLHEQERSVVRDVAQRLAWQRCG